MPDISAGTITGRLRLDTSEWRRGLQEGKRETDRFVGDAERGFGGLAAAVRGLGAAFIATKVAEYGYGIVKLGADVEQTRIAFTTLLGTTDAANKHLEKLRDFAAKTPFEFDDLTRASRRMQALGFEAEKVIPMLTSIGDATAAMGGGAEMVDRVTTALGQMRSATKVTREDMNQLTEVGIPAWEILSKAIGKSTAQTMDLVTKGVVPADQAIQALLGGMSGKFGDAMAKQSETFNGKLSTLKDSVTELGKAFGEELLPMATDALNVIAQSVQGLNQMLRDFRWLLNQPVTKQQQRQDQLKYETALPVRVQDLQRSIIDLKKREASGEVGIMAYRLDAERQMKAMGYAMNSANIPQPLPGTPGIQGWEFIGGQPARIPPKADPTRQDLKIPRVNIGSPSAKAKKAKRGPSAAELKERRTRDQLASLENRLTSAEASGNLSAIQSAQSALENALRAVIANPSYGDSTSIGASARARLARLKADKQANLNARMDRITGSVKGGQSVKGIDGTMPSDPMFGGARPFAEAVKDGGEITGRAGSYNPYSVMIAGFEQQNALRNAASPLPFAGTIKSGLLDGLSDASDLFAKSLQQAADEFGKRSSSAFAETMQNIGAGLFAYSRQSGGFGAMLADVGGAAQEGRMGGLLSMLGSVKLNGKSLADRYGANKGGIANLAAAFGGIQSVANGEGGAFGGLLSGATAGASVGSFFPGLGTAIGAGIGALAGAIFGGNAESERRHREHMAKVDATNRALQRMGQTLEPVVDIFRSMSLNMLPTGVLQGGAGLSDQMALGARL